MTSVALKTEIQSGPLAAELAPLVALGNDSGVAAALNAKTLFALQPIPIFVFSILAAQTGVKAKLRAGLSSTNATIADICDTALNVMNNPHSQYLDLTDAGSMALVNALVGAGVVSAADKDALVKFCTLPASRAGIVFGFGTVVSHDDVAKSLRV